eukprot:6336396-Heterocapsa_arctica.AAC.1
MGGGSGSASQVFTLPKVRRGEDGYVPTGGSGVHYSKSPDGHWTSRPSTPVASRSPPPAMNAGPRAQRDGDAAGNHGSRRGADPKSRADALGRRG